MPRPLGPALLATLTATGCYTGRSESAAEAATIAATADTEEATASGDTDPEPIPDTTDISITVVDRASKPIVGARVHHADPDGHVHLTDGSGHLVLTGFRGTRQVIKVEGDGYAPGTAVVDLVPGHSMEARVTLLRRDPADPATFKNFDAGKGVEFLDFGAVQVSIPALALVDPDDPSKIPVVGPVAISVVPIDPTTDLMASPGPLEGLDRDGRTVPLRSLFMAEISVWQGNKQLQLHGDPDLDATIRYRLPPDIAAKYAASTMVPAWYYDFDAGLWIEDLDHDDSIVDADGFWTATVSHFTPWNADVPIKELGCVLVTAKTCAEDPCEPAPYVPVTAQGIDFLVTEITDEDGKACLNVPANAQGKIYLGLPGAPKSDPKAIPATSNASCGAPGDCAPVSLKLTTHCVKGSTQDCVYEGPPITNGVGLCRPPRRTCDGIAYGLCEGGHVPVGVNDACTWQDIDCDGLIEPAGPDCPCTKDKVYPCYDYPSQEHLYAPNQCKYGKITCEIDKQPSECKNAEHPELENPDDGIDNDCDGSLGAGDGKLKSSRVYHGINENADQTCANQQVWDVAVDKDYVYIAGTFTNQIDLDGCVLTNNDANQEDIFLARLNKDLTCDRAFQLRVGNAPSDGVRLARAPSGELAVLGTCGGEFMAKVQDNMNGPVSLLINCENDPQTMVAFFNADFTFATNKILGTDDDNMGPEYVDARAITYAENLGFVVTGGFTKASHNNLTYTKKSFEDIFIAAYLENGTESGFYQFGSLNFPNLSAWTTAIEAVPGTGKLLIAGNFEGGLFFKDGLFYQGNGAFVARFAINDLSAPQKVIRMADTSTGLVVNDMSGNLQGQVFAVGTFSDDVIIGDVVPTINLINSGDDDGVLLPIGPDFMPQQPIVFNGGTTSQKAHRVALNNANEPHVAGEFATKLTVPPMNATNPGVPDAFLVKHTAQSRDPLWIWHASAVDRATVHGLAIDTDQFSYVVGSVAFTSALGPPGWCTDGFIAKIPK